MTLSPIALQARMIQNSINFWQVMFVMQRQWLDAMMRAGQSLPEPEKDASPDQPAPAPVVMRQAAGA